MPIHDYVIDNGTGANVRADINAALSAIVSLNSNPTQPGTMYAYQLWADTTSNLLKIRNGGNSAWITLRQLDGDFSIVAVEDGLQATPSLTFTNDLNTGVFRSGADALAIVTGGQYAIACTSTQAVGIRTPNPSTALHVAGNARVGADDVTDAHLQIGKGATGNRNSYIDIVADTTYTDYGLRIIRNNTGANATSELKHRGTGALNFTTQEAAPIVFNTTNSPALTITSGGLVGIGVTSPSYPLDVKLTNDTYILAREASINLTTGFRIAGPNNEAEAIFSANSATGEVRLGGINTNYFQTFYANNSEKARIDTSGRLLVGTITQVGNANGGILQLGSGITFPATPVAATDVNTLDDYEEGTWEPRIADDGTAFVGTTYTARNGIYRKVGSLVYVSYDIDLLLAGTLTGSASIGNLPFPVANSGDLRNGGGSIGLITGIQQNYVYQSNYPQNNSTYLYIIGRTAASSATSIVSSSNFFANSMRIAGQAWYSV